MLNRPAVLTAHVDWRRHADSHLLLVVLRGRALLVTAKNGPGGVEERHLVPMGRAVLLPAGMWHRLEVDSGGVTVPIGLPVKDLGQRESDPACFRFDRSWEPWLLHHFVSDCSPVKSIGQTVRDLFRTVTSGGGSGHFSSQVNDGMILSPVVGTVTAGLLHDPSDSRDALQWAEHCGVSVRTFHRRFREDIGVSFGAWRRALRLDAAQRYLRCGYDVTWVADRVGFGNASVLIRSFREHYGVSPGKWARRQSDRDTRAGEEMEQRARLILTMGRSGADAEAPTISGSVTGRRAHPGNLLLWVYVGRARVTVAQRHFHHDINLVRGEAVWIPAGVVHEVKVHPESVLLPLGFGVEEATELGQTVRVAKIPPAGRDRMLWHTMANLTLIRPVHYDRTWVLDIIRDSVGDPDDFSLEIPKSPGAYAVATGLFSDLCDGRDLAAWAGEIGVNPRDLDRCFREETGRSFTSWRATLRLRAAHDLMAAGTTPSSAARRVGYRHLSGFSRDFSRHYGMTPREFMGWGSDQHCS